MRRWLVVLGASALMLTLAVRTEGAYFINTVQEFVGGIVFYQVQSSGAGNAKGCHHWVGDAPVPAGGCSLRTRWTIAGGHDDATKADLKEWWGRQYRDRSTTVCFTETTTIQRYRLTSGIPAEGASCTGNSEAAAVTKVYTATTCPTASDTRDDGTAFYFDFAGDSPTANSYHGYRERLTLDLNGGTDFVDGCYKFWWY